MLLPLGTDRPIRRPTKVVYWLIALNISIAFAMTLIDRVGPQTTDTRLGLHDRILQQFWLSYDSTADVVSRLAVPADDDSPEAERLRRAAADGVAAMQPIDLRFKPWGLITYQFLHGGLLHLLGNMLFLWVFGPPLEDRLGRWWFLAFYLVGGIAAGVAHMVFSLERIQLPAGETIHIVGPVIGASGSIAACTGAFLCLFPKTRIKVLFFFFLIGVFYIPAAWFIAFAIFRDLFMQGLESVTNFGGGVAYAAHLGGYAFGFIVAYAALATGRLRREPYDLFSMHKQIRRRRAYRDLVEKRGTGGWTSEVTPDSKVQAHKRRRDPRATHSEAVLEAAAAERSAVAKLVDDERFDDAVRGYRLLLEKHGEQALPRDQQLALANHLNATGMHTDAATAYQQFAKRYPSDPETNRVWVLLALVQSRQLNDPLGAGKSLSAVKTDRLTPQERELYEALKADVE